MKLTLALTFAFVASALTMYPVFAQPGPSTGPPSVTPTATPIVNVAPVHTPPPVQTPPVRTPPIIHVPTIPTRVDNVNPVLPIDVTHTTDMMNSQGEQLGLGNNQPALGGIVQLKSFPAAESLKGSTDFILVVAGPDGNIKRETPYTVSLERGTVLASVRRPSQMGILRTPLGDVAFGANSDAAINFDNGVLRVYNIDGLGQTIKVLVTSGPLSGKTFSVGPGFEFVVADHKLAREDVRRNDGVLRRNTQILESGHAGVAEFSVESYLQGSALTAKLTEEHDKDGKAKRVLSDMSRMAAVLNHMNGQQGYTAEK